MGVYDNKFKPGSTKPKPSKESKPLSPEGLGERETAGSTVGSGGLLRLNDSKSKGFLKKTFWGTKRRRQATIGGSITGFLIGGGLLGLVTIGGPGFEIIHLAQLLEQFHMGNQKNLQDSEFVKMIRLAKNIPNGTIERSRMGYLGNKVADYYEGKLNASGLTSTYTKRYGLFDGYKVDTTEFGDLQGEELKSAIAEKYGIPTDAIVSGNEITGSSLTASDMVIEAASLKFRQTYLLNYDMLKQADLNGISAAIGARFMCKRASCDWHPFSNLIGSNLKRKVEEWLNTKQTEDATGETPITGEDSTPPPSKDSTGAAADTANQSTIDTSTASIEKAAKDSSGNPKTILSFKKSLAKKFTLGGLSIIGVLCILKSLNNQIDKIKETEIVLPLIRMGMQVISEGNQIMSGQGFNVNEVNAISSQLNGVDSTGKTTNWYDSQSIQANLGHPNIGEAPNPTLTSIGKGSPFSWINDIPGIGAACSTVGQIVGGVVSFALDWEGVPALLQGIAKGVVVGSAQSAVINSASGQTANWLAGQPVNTAAVGASFGNSVDYGAALAANQQAVESGGSQLSSQSVGQLQSSNTYAYTKEFQQHSLSYRMFSVDDPRSFISNVLADIQPSVSANITSFFSSLFNISSTFSKISSVTFKSVYAQSTTSGYNYGFPTYGFSEQDLNNPINQNPFENARYVTKNLLNNSTYISKAQSCFGVDIQNTDGRWNVTSSSGQQVNPYSSTYGGNGCNEQAPSDCTGNSSDSCNWLRVRLFILDTETMNSMACYAGGSQSCSDIGFN